MKNRVTREPKLPTFSPVAEDTWVTSLRSQLQDLWEEHKNPPAKIEITAKKDMSALNQLVGGPTSYVSLIKQVRATIDDIVHPKEKPEVTAEPIEVEGIWTEHSRRTPGLISLASHIIIVVLVMFPILGFGPDAFQITETFVPLMSPPLILNLPEEDDQSGGGGGGGLQEETPPTLGELPKAADQQLVPPTPEILNTDPILVAEPTVVAPQLANLQSPVNFALLGALEGLPGPPSAGPGVGGGIGTGQGRGVGQGGGPGVGEGQGGGFGGGVFRIGGGVSPPTILFKVDPQYSEEARKARYQGTVVLEAIVRSDGTVDILRVIRSLGFGLDENAIQALKQWKFRPGMRNGAPVDVALNIEVNFNLR